ncbi:Phage portal protein [Weissella confusa]|uniref:phage portal protein n=1 Tax=Weissella confusa TaxID=1583 RepID=UPI0022FE3C34|nr:phage portal protein [Weissella confusa]MDA5458651.1 Phage portal protein [Weissella confusa]MDY2528738.1 phage portal protein [Weissella confusa]
MAVFKPPKINNMFAATSEGGSLDEGIVSFLTGGDSSYVSVREAIHNSDLYSLVSQVSGDLASSRLIADATRTQGILNNPDPRTNPHAFWQSFYAQLLFNGEAFAYRWRNANGQDQRWEQLRPSQVQPYVTDDGTGLLYQVSFDEPMLGTQFFGQGDIIHMRLMSTNGGLTGISPLTALTNELNVKHESDKLTIQALKQSINANGVLSIKGAGLLDWKKKASRSKQFMNQYTSSNGGPIVLDDLEEFKPLEIKSNIAALLGQVNWTSTQIAKVYGVPDSYLNGSGDQQSSIDQIKGLYANALNRFISSAVGELNTKLSANITADIRPAIDPMGDGYIGMLAGIVNQGALGQNQFDYLVRKQGYLPNDMPIAIMPKNTSKGGETENEEN